MKKFLNTILKPIDFTSEWTGKIFSFIILPIIILQTVEVIRGSVFSSPTEWTWELVAVMAGGMFMLGGAWVLKNEGHVRADVIFAHLSKKWKAIFDVFFFTIIFFSFISVMIWTGLDKALYSIRIDERTFSNWGPPFWPLKTTIAISFILVGLQGLAKWIRDLYFLIKGEAL